MNKLSTLSRVKIPNKLFKLIANLMLDTIKIDEYTKKEIQQKIIERGYYSYISLLRKHIDFLTPLRLMILVDHIDILNAFKYYLRDLDLNKYEKLDSQNYNTISRLQTVEFKLTMLEQIYGMFAGYQNIGVMFHEKNKKFDVLIELEEEKKITLTDKEGYMYVTTLKPGVYAFESRPCCSIMNVKSILNDERRTEYKNKFERYFIIVPRDTTIDPEASKELEKNNINIIYSMYSTIDIVNDVAFMEGILKNKM